MRIDYTASTMKKHLNGARSAKGVILARRDRVTSDFVALTLFVNMGCDTAQINEHFVLDDNTNPRRVWTITLGEAGQFHCGRARRHRTAKGATLARR